MRQIEHFIDNVPVPSADGRTFETVDPYRREAWDRVARGGAVEAERAVRSARRAFDEGPWPSMSPDERGTVLHRLADLVEVHADELAGLDTTDMGRPISQSRGADVPRAARNLRFFADYARLAEAEVVSVPGHHAYTVYEPAGVVAAISPWNFPLMQGSWKVAPALAFGNTVILKPAEQAPASCSRLAELGAEAGLPSGVLNVVHGYGPGEVGEALTAAPGVDRITFTGESATGRRIMAAAAETLKPLSLEMGGKGASVVFADADLERTVPWLVRTSYLNSGQVCLAGSRLYVEKAIYGELVERFVAAAEALRTGDPADDATDVGPLSSEEHWRKVSSYLDIADEEGATVVTGGKGDGWSIRPTVVADVDAGMRVCREEIFGPVVTVQPFDGDDEAVALANDTPYGLSAMVFTENVRRAHSVAGRIRAGNVWVNCYFVRDLRLPFGGMKDSGIGREGGRHSREFFTEAKAVVLEL